MYLVKMYGNGMITKIVAKSFSIILDQDILEIDALEREFKYQIYYKTLDGLWISPVDNDFATIVSWQRRT